MPEEFISDQGAEFDGQLLTELCKSLNITNLRTSPYRPSTNEMVERYHRTLNQMLGKVVGETHRDWNLHVPAAAVVYRASEHVVTGFTPNFMMLEKFERRWTSFLKHQQVKKSFGQARTISSPKFNRDIERHTLLLGRISECKWVGGRMSTIVKS